VLQVLVTPHSAFLTEEALANIANTTIDNISKCLLGEPLGRNEVVYTPPPPQTGNGNGNRN
jgi:D-lactate dehydrogenase